MKTAIEILIEYIEEWQPKNKFTDPIWHKAKSLLETEKQQIIDLCTEAYELGLAHKEYSALLSYDAIFNVATNKETLK